MGIFGVLGFILTVSPDVGLLIWPESDIEEDDERELKEKTAKFMHEQMILEHNKMSKR